MKSLNEILNESSGDELLGRMMAEYKVFISTLKSLGFEKAPIGSSTYKPGPNRGKVEELWGIPMRAGKWADIFFAVMYDDRLPWRIIDRDGTESYAKLNDVNKALMKRIRTIKEEQSDEEVDPTGEALSELEDICEMADELYETLSDLDEIDSETRESITAIYLALDDLYENVDKKYEVTVDADEYEEVNEEVDMTRFKQLASTGLVSREELPKLVLAMRALDADKPLSMSQKDLINSTFQSLIAIVTGDTSVLSKVKSSIANN
jgi:hypothetical protein